jgi:hypothetical protein
MPIADASLPLQKAIVATLQADPTLSAIVHGRVYDNVPAPVTFPYVSIGPFQVLPEAADCSEGVEIFVTLDGWSRDGGKSIEAKRLGAAIGTALHEAALTLDNGQRLVSIALEQINYLRDPDGLTAHAAVTVRALTEPSNP